jgi:hypothetical protein
MLQIIVQTQQVSHSQCGGYGRRVCSTAHLIWQKSLAATNIITRVSQSNDDVTWLKIPGTFSIFASAARALSIAESVRMSNRATQCSEVT